MEKIISEDMRHIIHNMSPKLILAPMVRIGTLPFRLLSLKHGADQVFTEEIIAKKLRLSEKVENKELGTNDYISIKDGSLVLRTHPDEKGRLILQIGASDPEDAVQAALVAKDDVVGVDLNMGCPKHFSTHGNMGKSLVKNSGLPVSCKIRLLESKEKTRHLIETIQSSGIKFFTVHLRKKDQQPNIKANWHALLDIKEYAKIPFNCNGDFLSPLDIYKIHRLNICSGFMIARGAIHNPALFEQFKNFSLDEYLLNSGLSLNPEDDDFNNDYEEIVDNKNDSAKTVKKEYNNNNNKNDDIKVSNKLSKIFEDKYNKQVIDIIPLIREFVEIALTTGNHFGNTKFISLYILKTHKKHFELFRQIQSSKSYDDLVGFLQMEAFYEDIKVNHVMRGYFDGSNLRNRFSATIRNKKNACKNNSSDNASNK